MHGRCGSVLAGLWSRVDCGGRRICQCCAVPAGQGAVLANVGQAFSQFLGNVVTEWHHGLGLVGGVTEHNTLVTGTDLFGGFADVYTLGNVWGLLFNGNDNTAFLVVEAFLFIIVA